MLTSGSSNEPAPLVRKLVQGQFLWLGLSVRNGEGRGRKGGQQQSGLHIDEIYELTEVIGNDAAMVYQEQRLNGWRAGRERRKETVPMVPFILSNPIKAGPRARESYFPNCSAKIMIACLPE